MSELRTIDLPLRWKVPAAAAEPGAWRETSCDLCQLRGEECALDALVRALTPERGVQRATIDRAAGKLHLQVIPDRFSLDQAKAIAQNVGLRLEGEVHHCILDLPTMGRVDASRTIEKRLMAIPGVARAAVNPVARTVTIEYLEGSQLAEQDLLGRLKAWGYAFRSIDLPADWWERHRLLVYTAVTAIALGVGWLLSALGASPTVYIPLAAIAYLAGGGFAARNGLRALRRGEIDVDTLMVTAALGAALIGEWVEGGVLLFLFALSNALEHYAMDRTRRAIRSLMDLRPEEALVLRDGKEVLVAASDLAVGDQVIVRPGERIAADGHVREGLSAVDQSPITGESIPVEKVSGDKVFAGTINGAGRLEIGVSKPAAETTLARIIQLVEEARSERAPTQRRLDAFEQRYAVVILAGAALMALLPPLWLGWAWDQAFYRAMTLLVVASPCALVISTPASILSAIAAGARQGVLFKGGAHVERLAGIRVVAFDKTGTLTMGRPRVTDVLPLQDCEADELLGVAAAVEAHSEHPLARAIVAEASARSLGLPKVADLQAAPGLGVKAHLDGRVINIGTPRYLASQRMTLTDAQLDQLQDLEAQGKTVMLVGASGGGKRHGLLGLVAVADTVRPEAAQAIEELRRAGVEKVVMLTGDNQRAAAAIARQTGVDEVRAELMPEQKVDAIEELLAEHGQVAMVGDGVNDAPAMARATIGIAMGAGGTDVAMETADVVLMASDLNKLPTAIKLSRRSMRVVRQNLAFSLMVIGALIISTFFNLIRLPLGVVGHEGSTVIVVLNGLRLLSPPRVKQPNPTQSLRE
ncbi:MAG TPA: heavy metal translocating P-type ATPase [Anaerolineales bacterium]